VGLRHAAVVATATARARELLLHEGGTGGFRSFAGLIPEVDAGTVVLANQARSVGRLGLRVLDAIIHESPRNRGRAEVK